MSKSIISKRLRLSTLAVALGACLAGTAMAQSNSTGSIAGVTDAGATVTIENPATGFRREITASADGSYRLGALPTGTYKVTTQGQTHEVNVTIGGTAQATDVAGVTVKGDGSINAIDVYSVESTTILTAEQVARIPVGRNITNVALLAPGTVRGDAAFGNLASFGGSSVAENAYFVNGFNITNSFRNLNFGQVPYEAIAEQQIKTGGYGAEFGRSTGGVINLVTRRGSNEFHAGGNLFITPSSLTGRNPNVYSAGGIDVQPDPTVLRQPTLLADNSRNRPGTQTTASVWASGALIRDRLFAYALLQYGRTTGTETYGGVASSNNNSADARTPNWLLKMDWNISDSHLLELTGFSDTNKTESDVFTTQPDTLGIGRGARLGTIYNDVGGKVFSLKYTGYLSDNFTLSALVGNGESRRSNFGITANGIRQEYLGNVGGPIGGCPVITDIRTGAALGNAIPNCSFIGLLGSTRSKDERNQTRLDAEWQLGDHLLRFGYDADTFESFDAQSLEGGAAWQYENPLTAGPLAGMNRVRKRVFQTGAGVEVDSKAFYIEDKWQVTANFLAYVGLRWDSFENKNGDGQAFVKIDNQFGPRLGLSWDVNGDGRFKIFGNAGRYALPLTATVAVRGASKSLFSEEYYTYTGVDPTTGAPIGAVNVGNPNCGGCPTRYLNNEFGLAKDPRGIASENLEPMYQDEYILGFQTQITDHLSGGVRGIYRNLKRAIDDQCDVRPIFEYAMDHGLAFDPINPRFAFCHLYNPGSDGIFNVDVDNDGTFERIVIPAAVLGPKARRTYKAVEFFAEGQWQDFFFQGSYTWAKSSGNTEGGIKSDIGQQDTGTTQDFDYPELMIGADGDLPNDRRHTLKLYGNYEINPQWSIGASVLVQSGRPINCFGYLGGTNTSIYGNSYFSCDNLRTQSTADGDGDNGATVRGRGRSGRTPWSRSLDLNIAYRPAFAEGRLTFKADVFNLLNEHAVTSVSEFGENSAGESQFSTTYKAPTNFQAARSFRFMVQYDF
ncbi:TonB-dependent receptor [Arenimonas oryziterrae]|uniref:TonB-dependent transporter Oar-like beta-barrel domain-containing protein n=1 Tax=Arenimonas oryziterrae DSM 21050 = YC6267 TaxID=1121015 RepID=A0A091AT85_9GAMM|nr:TonB-dependent receptor [Arenimonas oryziterrae]KFN42556.1 hypothetical protein N789_13025 [Arenimonas oryziterrae DSM 21050 = YC6267]